MFVKFLSCLSIVLYANSTLATACNSSVAFNCMNKFCNTTNGKFELCRRCGDSSSTTAAEKVLKLSVLTTSYIKKLDFNNVSSNEPDINGAPSRGVERYFFAFGKCAKISNCSEAQIQDFYHSSVVQSCISMQNEINRKTNEVKNYSCVDKTINCLQKSSRCGGDFSKCHDDPDNRFVQIAQCAKQNNCSSIEVADITEAFNQSVVIVKQMKQQKQIGVATRIDDDSKQRQEEKQTICRQVNDICNSISVDKTKIEAIDIYEKSWCQFVKKECQ